MLCVRLEVTHDWSAAARFKFSTSGMVTKNSARLFSASALQRRRIDFIQKGACHVIAPNVFADVRSLLCLELAMQLAGKSKKEAQTNSNNRRD